MTKKMRPKKVAIDHLKGNKKRCLDKLLHLHKRANSGHIGSSLSCLDLLVYLFGNRLRESDEFILSKGHAASALYVILAEFGRIPQKILDSYYQDGTLLAAHPPCGNKLPAIKFGTGSLGHGLSLASGLAFSTRFTKKDKKVYCIISDGDCNEGSTWEAALFAAHHQLDNLHVIIDRNNLQGFGRSEDVLNLEPLVDKWQALGFDTYVIKDGHSLELIAESFRIADTAQSKKPKCFIALTTKGSGVSFMENQMEWHYLPMDDNQFEQALSEVSKSDA